MTAAGPSVKGLASWARLDGACVDGAYLIAINFYRASMNDVTLRGASSGTRQRPGPTALGAPALRGTVR
jgi:hypothetical protein